jgi:hypothetical protein
LRRVGSDDHLLGEIILVSAFKRVALFGIDRMRVGCSPFFGLNVERPP